MHGPGAADVNPLVTAAMQRGPSDEGMGFNDLMDMLFGGQGNEDMLAAISGSYDGQLDALRTLSGEMGAHTDQLIGNIHSSRDATNQQIGGFFDYAQGQANAGRPVIAETGQTAMGNVDSIYDRLGQNLAAIPGQSVAQASAAAGGAVGGSVAGRVAAATAPFQAAGETSRANTQANMVQHSAAGQDYLSQLAAAAPSEAAMAQGQVAGRANNAVTEAQMALSQQRAQIAAQTAALEGAKERALIEHSADTAGSTFERMMQTAQLMSATGSDMGPLRDSLGLSAAQGSDGDPLEELRMAAEQQSLMDQLAGPQYGQEGFQSQLGQLEDPTTQRAAQEIQDLTDRLGLHATDVFDVISRLTDEQGEEYTTIFGNTRRRNEPGAASLEDLFNNPDSEMFTNADQGELMRLFRTLFSG